MLSSNSQNLGYLILWSTLGLKACTFVLSRLQSLNTFGDYIKFRGQFTDCWFIPIFLLFICWFLRKVSWSLDCTWIFWVVNTVLDSLILLPLLPKSWHYKHVLHIPSTIFSSIYLTTQALRYLVLKFLFYFILLWGIGKWHMVAVSIKVSWQTLEDKVMLGWAWPFLLG